MSIFKKFQKEKKVSESFDEICFIDDQKATKGFFHGKFRLCRSCRDWIFHIKKYEYVYPDVLVMIKEKGRKPIVLSYGFVECDRCAFCCKEIDFRSHECSRIVKTRTWKMNKILELIRSTQRPKY